jgi:hypothetical protein
MVRTVVTVWVVAIAALNVQGAPVAIAQDLITPPPNILPPPPPPPPPPPIFVPKVPQMDEIPPQPKAALPRRGSFNERMRNCLAEGAAMGLGPNERAAYSRACANQ